MSYRHGDNCSRHWFSVIFILEVLSDLRISRLRIFVRFVSFDISSNVDGGNGGEAAKWASSLLWNRDVKLEDAGSVAHLAPDCLCHLCLGFYTSRCLALYFSGMSFKGSSETGIWSPASRRPRERSWEVPLLQELGNTHYPACSRADQMSWMVGHDVTPIGAGTDGGLRQQKYFWPLRSSCGRKASKEVLLLGTIYVVTLLVLWVLMHVKGILTFEWNLLVWNSVYSPLFSFLIKNSS